MKKNVLIHVGPPKTGTSAIQRFLNTNRNLLEKNGVFYPSHELGVNGISSGNLRSILEKDENDQWQVSRLKCESLMEEFQNSSAHTLLLSSEYFFLLVASIAEFIPTASFIAYVRCPLETYESSYNQSVKRHGKVDKALFGENLHTTTLKILTDSINAIGFNRFKLRAYLPLGVSGSNLLEDFLFALKLTIPAPLNEQTNTSYTLEALELKRWLNQFDLGELDHRIDSALQSCVFGTKNFSLIPEPLLAKYEKQSFHTVREFVTNFKTAQSKSLLAYLKKQSARNSVQQSISDEQFIEICRQICIENIDLFYDISKKITMGINKEIQFPHRINLFLDTYYKTKKSRVKTYIRKLFKT